MRDTIARPAGPYSLALSARLAGDATRTFRDGVFAATFQFGDRLERGWARQFPDGRVQLAGSDEAIDRLRFVLALDDDHSDFLRSVRGDPMLGRAAIHLRGLRPVRVGTVAQALLRALCGQLIQASRARAIERAIIRAAMPALDGWHAPPTSEALGRFSPAELRRLGLHARRGATLVRLCRSFDLERWHGAPTAVVADEIERQRGLGPWSAGVVCLEGLGRHERGLVGDLGLVKLLSAMRGRRVEGWETAELVEPYGEWAGIASVYLLAGWGRGLLPVPRAQAA